MQCFVASGSGSGIWRGWSWSPIPASFSRKSPISRYFSSLSQRFRAREKRERCARGEGDPDRAPAIFFHFPFKRLPRKLGLIISNWFEMTRQFTPALTFIKPLHTLDESLPLLSNKSYLKNYSTLISVDSHKRQCGPLYSFRDMSKFARSSKNFN